ncbi:hypothetical protein HHI36_011431 [Cryptolaemus montrouzieri]|uniref:lysoplasmalogenase n=1 Tax=Cryptolaemus montrouzieri TaxID=559131 RepID=A0ABD2MLQ4_9CUCU
MNSVSLVVKNVGPKLVPFFKTVAIYFVISPSADNPTIFRTVLKCLPIISLMLFVLLQGMSFEEKFKYSRRILIGLVFCCFGDAFLVWPSYFEVGMMAFALGHMNYILAFGFEPLNLSIGMALLALNVTGIMYFLPDLSGSILPVGVPIYILLLGTMLWRAVAHFNSIKVSKNWNKACAAIGGILFVLSDLVIGLNMFKFKINHAEVIIMSTYYAAQLGISLSVVDSSQHLTVK